MSENVSGIENNESKGTEDNKESEKPPFQGNFVSCEVCGKGDDVRIVLRQCGHVVCVPCALEYIKNRIIIDGHPRFKCQLASCKEVVHENDINALLDEKEPALEQYMPIGHRRYLQYKQNKHSVLAALPSSDIKRCPLCRSVYMHEPGCNYVICANSACATAFCWVCEKPIGRPVNHFTTASNCRLGYTDYERILRSVQLILDVNFVVLWIFFPFVYLIALLYIPVLILFLVPASLAYGAYRKERDSHNFLVPTDILVIIFRIVTGILIGVVVSVPMAIGSIVSGFLLIALYVGFLVIRSLPCGLSGDRVSSVLCLMRWAGRLFRIGPYGTLLKEARRERQDAMIKLEENQDDFENAMSEGPVLLSTTVGSSGTTTTNVESTKAAADTTTNTTTTKQDTLTSNKQ